MRSILAVIFGALSLMLFALNVVIHLFSLFPAPASRLQLPHIVLPLSGSVVYLGGMVVFFAMTIALSEMGHRIPKPKLRWSWRAVSLSVRRDALTWQWVWFATPVWARILLVASVAYCFACMTFLSVDARQLVIDGGTPYLVIDANPTPISWQEYFRIYWSDSRDVSGGFLLFTFAPTIYFLIVRRRLLNSEPPTLTPSPDTSARP